MKAVGGLLIAVGALLALYALSLDVSIPSYTGLGGLPDRVVNIQLLQNQSMMFNGGIALFVAGVIAVGLGRIEEAIRPQSPPVHPSTESDSTAEDSDNGLYFVIGVAIITLLIIVVAIAYGRDSGSIKSSGTSDAENVIDQANSDLENAQRAAEELLRQAAEAVGE